jgi:hypothetical protein
MQGNGKFLRNTCLKDGLPQCKRQLWKVIIDGMPVTVALRSDACTVFACSDAGIVGSNQCLVCVCVCVCVRARARARFSLFVYS